MASFDDDWDPFDRLVYRECAHTLLESEVQSKLEFGGFLYVASNKFFPGLLKIGATERRVEDRMDGLYNTNVPGPFTLEYAILVELVYKFERQVHDALEFCRVNPDREFFQVGNLEAVKHIRTIYLMNMTPEYNERFHVEAIEAARIRSEKRNYELRKYNEEILQEEITDEEWYYWCFPVDDLNKASKEVRDIHRKNARRRWKINKRLFKKGGQG